MQPLSFRERLTNCHFDFDALEEGDPFIDPTDYELMNDPRTLGEHTFDSTTIRKWIAACSREKKEVTNPLTRERISYDPSKNFDEQFPRNLALVKMIDRFVVNQEKLRPASPVEKSPIISQPEILRSAPEKPSKAPEIDERFDAVKEKDAKEKTAPSILDVDEEDKLIQHKDLERTLLSIDELQSWFKIMEKNGGPYIHFETPLHSLEDGINLILMQLINFELQSQGKVPIFQFRVRDYVKGVCTIINVNGLAVIVRVNPLQLQKIKESGQDIIALGNDLVKSIVKAMGFQVINFKIGKSDIRHNYLGEILTLWNKREQKKLDVSNIDDIKLILFKSILKNFELQDIYEWDGITTFVTDLGTKFELSILKERMDTFLDVFHQFESNIAKLGLELMILRLDKIFTDRQNISNITGKTFALTFQELWKTCLIFSQPDAFHVARSLANDQPKKNNLGVNLSRMLRTMQGISGMENLLSAAEFENDEDRLGKDCLIYAYLQELVFKWKFFKTQPGDTTQGKYLLFQTILKGCALLMRNNNKYTDFNSLLNSIEGLTEIAKDVNLTAYFFKTTSDMISDLRRKLFGKDEILKGLGVVGIFQRDEYVVFMATPKGQDSEMLQFASQILPIDSKEEKVDAMDLDSKQ